VLCAEELRELLVDDADHFLPGGQPFQDLAAGRSGLDAPRKVLGDVVVDIGLEEGAPDLPQRVADALLAQRALIPQLPERAFEFSCKLLEHNGLSPTNGNPTKNSECEF
jgi:hypothetical protein